MQQSRFLALISNVDLLKENIKNAEDSEDIGTLQYLKALDSLDSKIKQVEVSYQQFYTTIGIENVWKTFLDGTRNAIDTLNRLPKLFGKIPVLAIAMIGNIINVIRSALRIGFKMIITDWQTVQEQLANKSRNTGTEISEGLISMIIRKLRESRNQVVQEVGQTMEQARNEADNKLNNNQQNQSNGGIQQTEKAVSGLAKLGQNNGLTKTFTTLSGIASVVSLLIPTASQAGKVASGAIMGIAGALKVLGSASAANPVLAVISGIAMIASGIATAIESSEERLERLNAEAEELNNKAKEAKANYNTLQRSIDKVEELKEKRYESKEAAEEYQEAVDELADTFPEMISGFDEAGNIIVDITNKENILAEAREKTAKATYEAAQAELKATEEQRKQIREKTNSLVNPTLWNNTDYSGFIKGSLKNQNKDYRETLLNLIEGIDSKDSMFYSDSDLLSLLIRQGNLPKLLQENNIKFDNIENSVDGLNSILWVMSNIDITSDYGQNLYKQAKALYEKLKNNDSSIEDNFKELFDALGPTIDEYNDLNKLLASKIKTTISAWQNLNKEFSYITDGSGLAQILTDYIAQDAGSNITSDELKELLESDKYKKIQDEFEAYWEHLAQTNKTRADRLKEMLSNPERYTKTDILSEFGDFEHFDEYLAASYGQRAENVRNNLINSIEGNKEQKVPGLVDKLQKDLQEPLINLASNLEAVAGELSYEESQILGNAARKYVDMAKGGFAEQGKQMLLGAEYLINAVKDNPIEEAYLASLLSKNSLFTKDGVQAIIDGINENSDIAEDKKEELIKYLSVIKNNIINNYSLAIQTAIGELEEGWENAGKEMAKLRSGASLKEANAAIEAAKALGIEISRSDFSGPANKLVLSEGKFYEYFYATQAQVRAQADEMESYAQQAKNIIDGWSSGTLTEKQVWENFIDNKKLFSDILGEQFYTKVFDEGPDNFTKNRTAIEEKIKEYGEDVSEFQLMLEQTQEQMLREINWAIGNYADLFKNGFDESQLRSAAAQAGRNLNKTQISERDAVKKINEVYSKLISDVLSKGFTNIDLTQYSGLFYAGSGIAENLSGSYEEFVRKYVDLTGKTVEEINSLMVQAIEKDNKKTTVMTSAIKDMASLSVSQIGELANLLSEQLGQVVDPRAIIASIKQNADGTYNGSEYIVNYLIPKLFGEDVPEAVQNALDTTLNSAVENAIKGLNDISSNLSKGFSSIADVEKFGSQLKNVEFSKDFYRYEEVLNQYVLTGKGVTESIKNYAIELANVLQRQGKNKEEINLILNRQLQTLRVASAQQVDIQKYISSNKTEEDKKALDDAYWNWYYVNQAIGRSVYLSHSELDDLAKGGEAAVRIADGFAKEAGRSLTAKEVEETYRSYANKLEDAAQMLTYGIGSIIDETTADIVKNTGGTVDQIGQTSQYVITSTGDLAEAYLKLYDKMAHDNATTLTRLNEIMALHFEASSEKEAIDFVGDAAKMSWTRLAEAFSKAGYNMTTELIDTLTTQGIIKDLNNGNVRVLKPEQLLNALGMNPNSDEYTFALKTLNDSLIEANNKISNNIVEEVKNIAAAKPGEQINITQLYKELDETSQKVLVGMVHLLGAELDGGILTLTENANILGLVENISTYAEQKGILLESQMAELADTLNDTLESYIDLFSKGIQGNLSHEEARSLQNYATTLGINKLDFTETSNGLKISANSAGALYSQLKQVDSIKASLVFDELSESIQKSNENASNLSVTLKTISSLEKELAKTPDNAAVKQRLELYKEIAAQQAADPEQYNFMNRSLPSGMQGVENYWNSVGSAFKAMNEAGKSGYMEVQDFYNIVNEMSNLAALSGNSIEFMGQTIDGKATTAASLIQNAMSALTNVDGEGVKLSLDKLGANLLAGAEGMESGFDDGIKAMANAQIKMLDAAIQMLEGIVALQELGNIDDNENGAIDFDELFFGDEATQDVTGFQTNAQKAAKDVLNAAKSNDDLMAALDTFKIGELKLRDILNAIANNKWSDIKDKITPQQLLDLFNVFKDIDFENADLISIQQVIDEAWNKIFPDNVLLNDQEVLDRVSRYLDDIEHDNKNVTLILQRALNKARAERSVQERLVYEIANNQIDYNKDLGYIGANGEQLGKDPEKALIQNILLNAGYSNKEIKYNLSKDGKASSGKIKVNYEGLQIEVKAGIDEEIKYSSTDDIIWYSSLDEAIKNSDAFKEFKNENKNVNLSEEELLTQFKYDVGIEINPRIKIDTEKFQNAEKTKIAQVKELMKQALSGELEIGADELVQDAKEIGIELTLDKNGNLVMSQLEGALAAMTESIQAINNNKELDYLEQIAQDTNSIAGEMNGSKDNKDTSGQDETGGKEVTPEEDVSGQDKKATTEKNTNNESINSNWLVGIIDQFKAAPSDSKAILDAAGITAEDLEILNKSLEANTEKISEGIEKNAKNADYEASTNWKTVAASLLAEPVAATPQGQAAQQNLGSVAPVTSLPSGMQQRANIEAAQRFRAENGIDVNANANINAKETVEEVQEEVNSYGPVTAEVELQVQEEKLEELKHQLNNWLEQTGYSFKELNEKIQDGSIDDQILDEYLKLKEQIDQCTKKIEELRNEAEKKSSINIDGTQAQSAIDKVKLSVDKLRNVASASTKININTSSAHSAINNLLTKAQEAASKLKSFFSNSPKTPGATAATGNVALAAGRTLMGELGPELYVTRGHYYVAGQNGAEFVNLPEDAIVFNHIQTKRLLTNGNSGRGVPVTNERKATSLATGNTTGPAMASAAAVLAQLKQIRAMWDALLHASVSDLGSKAGLGKSGGGGGKDKDDNKTIKLDAGYIRDLEKWYNLLRKIERLEIDINYEEKLRAKLNADSVAHGEKLYESYKRSFDLLQQEVDNRVKLAELKKGYWEQQMKEAQESEWGRLFTFDENGTVQMKEGTMQLLANIYGSSATGGALHSAREQYAMLQQAGFGALMEYKDDGSRIEWTNDDGTAREEAYKEAVEAFSSRIDSTSDELKSLYEEYMGEMESILDLQTKQNEILNQIKENTVSVEQEVISALEESREREINELQKSRDALNESTDKFINGLTDQLNKEREMYQTQQTNQETMKLQRQLAILQRSGGSASQIANLQEQISQRQQDAYFEAQEKQINAIKEASNLQLERLDAQISIMNETLEYQKEHGLLWEQVQQIMSGSAEEIYDFITGNKDEWWSKSQTQRELADKELNSSLQLWVANREDLSNLGTAIKTAMTNGIIAITSVVSSISTSSPYTVTGDGNPITTTPSGGGAADGGAGGGSSGGSSTAGQASRNNNISHYKFTYNGVQKKGYTSENDAIAAINALATEDRRKKITNNMGRTEQDYWYTTIAGWVRDAKKTIVRYSKGGLIDFTGPAWVDGTKERPEGILNAEQLDMLRNMVLTKRNPLMNILADYNNTLNNTANNPYGSINHNSNESIVIENATVNMNVQKIANDYDARRAGELALDEMVKIAQKNGFSNIRR